VDLKHFGRARNAETVVPPDLSHLAKPVLGYFGVIDERLDYELIARLADANPRGSIVMIGPVIKVEERALPRRRNLYWLGGRDYSQLPAYCKGFSLCLMPFALNAATEFINPTKALEYMATGKMIVSSAVPDVVRNFGAVVKVASHPDEFISLCHQAVARPDPAAIERGLSLAADNSWESIVEQLEKHVEEALARGKLRMENGGVDCQGMVSQGVESLTEPV
jgi:glycosyltransferase involved in cell wall biosynthesis